MLRIMALVLVMGDLGIPFDQVLVDGRHFRHNS